MTQDPRGPKYHTVFRVSVFGIGISVFLWVDTFCLRTWTLRDMYCTTEFTMVSLDKDMQGFCHQ